MCVCVCERERDRERERERRDKAGGREGGRVKVEAPERDPRRSY